MVLLDGKSIELPCVNWNWPNDKSLHVSRARRVQFEPEEREISEIENMGKQEMVKGN